MSSILPRRFLMWQMFQICACEFGNQRTESFCGDTLSLSIKHEQSSITFSFPLFRARTKYNIIRELFSADFRAFDKHFQSVFPALPNSIPGDLRVQTFGNTLNRVATSQFAPLQASRGSGRPRNFNAPVIRSLFSRVISHSLR